MASQRMCTKHQWDWKVLAVLLLALSFVTQSVVALSNGQATTPLMGHAWKECALDKLPERARQLRTRLPGYDVIQVGKNCIPASNATAPKLEGTSIGIDLGEACLAVRTFNTHLHKAWNVSLIQLHRRCLQLGKEKKQLSLRGVAVSVCSLDQLDLPWLWAPALANQWCIPTSNDTPLSEWESMLLQLDNAAAMAQFAGPGAWNDLGPLQVGAWSDQVSTELKEAMDRSQFALWAMLKSPLMLAANPADLTPSSLAVLTNREVVAVNQDILGVPGSPLWRRGSLELFAAPLSHPGNVSKRGQRVVLCFNRANATSHARGCVVQWAQLGYPPNLQVAVENLYTGSHIPPQLNQYTTGPVGPRDVVVVRFTPLSVREATRVQLDMWKPWQHNPSLFHDKCQPPGIVIGGLIMMTMAVLVNCLAGLTFYWVWATPSRKEYQPMSGGTKSDEQA